MNGRRGRPEAAPGSAQGQLAFGLPQARAPERDEGEETEPAPPEDVTDDTPTPRRADPRVYTVGELVKAARLTMESRFTDVRVEGEISGARPSGPGHLYFSLKEPQAQIDCVMFSRELARLKFKPADGLNVQCRGRLTIYEGRGRFQMMVTEMVPAGAGALALAFEQLKQKLAAEGLFEVARKRRLPFLPRRVGIVTSPTGAVIRDILHVVHRRFPVPVLVSPTPVQGEGAAMRIVAALERLWRVADVEVIIVARGGGSLEDLWAFNEEIVARAIARSPVPVISAVGHETDFTIADFVADQRAPTPSAAAEIVVPDRLALREQLAGVSKRLARAMDAELRRGRLGLERLQRQLGDPRRLIDRRRQTLDDLAGRGAESLARAIKARRSRLQQAETRLLRAHPQRRIGERRQELAALEKRLVSAARTSLDPRRRALDAVAAKLGALSPLNVLERGYGLVRTKDGHVVTSSRDVEVGLELEIKLREGVVGARVESASGDDS
jgi:exodeoxyribonuclease VII large subunit